MDDRKARRYVGQVSENASTKVGIQGNMVVVQNMWGIIATEVGRSLGVAMQNAVKAGQAKGTRAGKDMKPYTQDQVHPPWFSRSHERSVPDEGVAHFQGGKDAKL